MLEQAVIFPLNSEGLTLEAAGGKGCILGTLLGHGFPVPRGFIIATDAYRRYVEATKLTNFILSTVDALHPDNTADLRAAELEIRAQFTTSLLPSGLVAMLREAYAALGWPPAAVRSSATTEDLPEMSFAGQHDTYLNVMGDKALLEAVVSCWSSLWTARAIGYRVRNGISHQDVALAVVVQEMVPSEVSGVLFTANPLDGKRTEMVIEATVGLGEALVSGQVEPDRYLVEAASGDILSKRLGAKALAVLSTAGRGTTRRVEDASTRQTLPDAAVEQLATLGQQVAELFGTPQDIEWTWADGRLHLLQSRPITTLFPLPVGMGSEPLQVMLSFAAVQGIMEPFSPLGQDAVQAVFAGAAGLFGQHHTMETQNAIKVAAERLFVNFTGLIRHRVYRPMFRLFLAAIEPSVSQAMEPLWDDARLAPSEGFGFRTFRQMGPLIPPFAGRLILSLLRPDTERIRLESQIQELVVNLEAKYTKATTLAERVALMEEMMATSLRFLLPRFVPRFGAGMASLNVLNHLVASLPNADHNTPAMTRGLPHNVTTEMDLALWQVAQDIKSDAEALARFDQAEPDLLAADYLAGRLPERAQTAIASFLTHYGMRGPGEIDLGRSRWRESPAPIMQVLQSYLQITDADQAPDTTFERGSAVAQAAIQQMAGDIRMTRGGWFKTRLVKWAASRMRALVGLRESPKFGAIRIMGIVRAALLESGREVVQAGVLTEPDDLFFLRLHELKALAHNSERDWITLVQERRQALAREQRRKQIPRLLLTDGQAFYGGMAPLADKGEGILTGSPVSPGMVEGAVHVVHDPQGAQLAPGEILVCTGTDPAWTPLFLVAGGVVMEVGGLMTHGSVVAREYGIPAVVGVDQATSRLETGQRVRVDGSTGQVVLL